MTRTPMLRTMIRTVMCAVSVVSLAALFVALSAPAFAQGGAATGDLYVTVKDPAGNVVTSAKVSVRDPAKGLERTATSDGQGGYGARLLPPGTYTVTIDAPGFSGVLSTGVVITVGGLVDLPVTLSVSGGKEVVEVTSQPDLVETSRTSTTDTIGQRRIDNLPINGRNYINFTLTDSQVVRDNAPSTWRRAHIRPEYERTARALQPGQRRRSRRHRQLRQRRALYRLAGSGAGISDHHQQLCSPNTGALPAA